MDLNSNAKRWLIAGSMWCLCGCVSVPKKASTTSGEVVHQAGASRERCLEWLMHTSEPTPYHWIQLLDELAAEPEDMRKQSVARVAPYLEQWPDELRSVPSHWTPQDLTRHALLLPLVRHLDFSRLHRTWGSASLEQALPSVTVVTLRTVAQFKHLHEAPQLLPNAHHVRVRVRASSTDKAANEAFEAFFRGPWRERLTSLDMKGVRMTPQVFDAVASLPPKLKRLDLSLYGGSQDKEGVAQLEAWIKSPQFAHIESLHLGIRPGPLAKAFVDTVTQGPKLKRLRSMTFSGARFTQEQWAALGAWPGWTGLEELSIVSAYVTPTLTKAMSANPSLSGLRRLTLRATNLTDEAASWLGHTTMLNKLVSLNVSRNRLTTQGMWGLLGHKQLMSLEHLNASYNRLSSGIGARLAAPPHGSTLKRIELDGNPLDLLDAQAMAQAPWKLEHLSLNRADMDAASTQALLSAPWLGSVRHLSLARSAVNAEGMRALTRSRALPKTLNLSHAGLDDASLKLLMNSDQVRLLEQLNISGNAWSHAGTTALSQAKNMERLMFVNLRQNDLGPPERIGEVANSPTMLHMHRALLSPKRIDLSHLKGVDVSRNEVSAEGGAAMASSMSHIPALGERVVKSAYLSTALRRLLNLSLIEAQEDMDKNGERIPAAAKFLLRRYIARIDAINRQMAPGQSFVTYTPREKPPRPERPRRPGRIRGNAPE